MCSGHTDPVIWVVLLQLDHLHLRENIHHCSHLHQSWPQDEHCSLRNLPLSSLLSWPYPWQWSDPTSECCRLCGLWTGVPPWPRAHPARTLHSLTVNEDIVVQSTAWISTDSAKHIVQLLTMENKSHFIIQTFEINSSFW